jgi:glucokinase
MHQERYYAAVDLGATNVRVSYGNAEGLREKITERTDRESGPEGVADQILQMLELLDVRFQAIGVGSIGPIFLETGTVINTPNLPFDRVPVVEPLREAYKVPVGMLNDCSAAVVGEQIFGAGKGLKNLAYVTLSTGLGGGAIVDGNLLVGKDGNAVEVGHLTIDPNSSLICGCGCKGHWEAYCSGSHIPDYARLLIEELELDDSHLLSISGGDRENITTEGLYKSASTGDTAAQEIVRRIGEVNAIGIADMVNVFDPELVTIGGSIALNNPELTLDPIIENIDNHLINRRPEIMITPLGADAVLHGALVLAIRTARKVTEEKRV